MNVVRNRKSDTDLTLGDTTDAETTNNNTTIRPTDINRQESMRSEMTESDWDFEPTTTVKPAASLKPKPITPTKSPATGKCSIFFSKISESYFSWIIYKTTAANFEANFQNAKSLENFAK